MALPISNTRSAEMERVRISRSVPTAGPTIGTSFSAASASISASTGSRGGKEIQDVTIEFGSDERSHGGIL